MRVGGDMQSQRLVIFKPLRTTVTGESQVNPCVSFPLTASSENGCAEGAVMDGVPVNVF